MESILFIFDALALASLAVWSLLNDRRKPGAPLVGLFRYEEDARVVEAPVAETPERTPPSTGWRGRTKNRA